jgi:sn-glycerol 3-phosphate transport system substrate-binding protein
MRTPFIIFLTIFLLLSFSPTTFSDDKTTIQFHIPSSATLEMSRMYRYMLSVFEDENPSIHIDFQPSSSYDGVLNKVLEFSYSNKSFGVAVIEISELFTLKEAGAIIPFNEVLNKKEMSDVIKFITPEFLVNSYNEDGEFYGLPLMRSTPIIYYNMTHLKKVGFTEDELPRNWNELIVALQKLKNEYKKPPFVLANDWYDWLFEAFVKQNGGALTNKNHTQVQFDHQATIDTLVFWKYLYDEGLMTRVYGTWKANLNGFLAGQYSVIYYSSGGLGALAEKEDEASLKFEWMVDLMPKNKIYSTPFGGANLFLSAQMTQDETKAAIKLIKFLLKPENQAKISKSSGYFPVVKEAYHDPRLKKLYSRKQFKRAKKQLDFANTRMMTKHNDLIRIILKKAIDRTLEDNIPPAISLKEAQESAEELLK